MGVRAPWLEIAAPPWSAAPYTLQAGDVILGLRHGDPWRAYRGAPLRIDTAIEVQYYQHGGILPFVLRRLMAG